ncbi:16S rRNA (cytosine(1402)-N(4))-methyltransferase RsmH [Robiginitalea sp. M366]|uniref:16S rRNA (cytosine(1402)-N(4))-methyltransferase RsmH n=1 Tax=Robiginitalea aestuariiviva TaxID=3036903 RepID=UPI00240DAB3A|nr:16S rRNA (cytosine(1402)-N(4))-methyltransferase RsmH [Robiginitalea aestuariiviva]MDG1570865.1 16S rRNA (cytosine(1402)-N(4))-methyltransferase RsmH [Robiginitalea aestuariiviva]
MTETPYHNPVLLQESVDGLAIREDGVYVDVTFGGGGHSREILRRLGPAGRLIAFDQDEDALANAPEDDRFMLIHENFRYLKRFLKFYGILKVDGILADFGVSSHQFDQAERGFSTRLEGELDMRMSRRGSLSARDVVGTYSFEQLRDLFRDYGELRNAAQVARALINAREHEPLRTTADLREVVQPCMPRGKENKGLAQVYQAIRMEVNQELQVLREFLEQTPELLRTGGRLSLISYHSLEDRLAKRFIRAGKFEGEVDKDFYGNPIRPLKAVGKLIVPSEEEIRINPRARSAKLRIAERQESK